MPPHVLIFALIATVVMMFTSDKKFEKGLTDKVLKAMKNAHSMTYCRDVDNLIVDDRMHRALCCPLTPEEVEIINTCTFCDQKRFSYNVQNAKWKNCVFTITILVSVTFSAPHLDLRVNHQNVPVTVTCTSTREKGMYVTHVEKG